MSKHNETPAKPAEKPSGRDEVLRAKPVEGEIDHVALIREHMRRYPNIIAALARAERQCADRKRNG
jgi:hypothetical protein